MHSLWTFLLPFALAIGLATNADAGPRNASLTGVININTANESELRMLPGIGQRKAELIVLVRTKRKFDSPEQIRRVKGIGLATYRRLKPYLSVSGETTLATASASATPTGETKAVSPSKTDPVPKGPAAKPPKARTPVAPKAPARA